MNIRNEITSSHILKESRKSRTILASIHGYSKKVIIKELPGHLERIYRTLSQIENPHLPRIYQIEREAASLFITEEWIEGKTLASLLERRRFSPLEAIHLMLQLCDGIEVLHSAIPPVIHRDLTPWNLILTKDHILKIVDFDAARIYKKHAACDTHRLGTLEYAPPEQFGFAQTDARSDIYSMGVIFYELIYCRGFFRRSRLHSHASRKLKKINAVISRCTMFSPSQRYQSVREVRKALLRLLPLRLRLLYPAKPSHSFHGNYLPESSFRFPAK